MRDYSSETEKGVCLGQVSPTKSLLSGAEGLCKQRCKRVSGNGVAKTITPSEETLESYEEILISITAFMPVSAA